MAKRYDATTKHLIETHPADWLTLAGLPAAGPMRVVDADVSTVTASADKVLRVDGPAPVHRARRATRKVLRPCGVRRG